MRFIIQTDSSLESERNDLLKLLNRADAKIMHTYKEISLEQAKTFEWNKETDIPVGTIDFTSQMFEYLGIKNYFEPLEVPDCLRVGEFLNRDYRIVEYNKLPKEGYYFIKDASILKNWMPQYMEINRFREMAKDLDKDSCNHKFVLTDIIDIEAEYRVLVCNDEAKAVQYYNGRDVLKFPSEEILRSMINTVTLYRDIKKDKLPRSYTIDVAVDSNGNTSIIEMHNFVSCGTYGFNDNSLIQMYIDGIRYELQYGSQ